MLRTSSGQTMFRFLGKEEAKAYVNRIADVSVESARSLIARRPRRMSSMDAEEKLVLNHIRDAGNMGACLSGPPSTTVQVLTKVYHRNLESDPDDQDGLASRDDCQGAQGPRREKDHQDGQVGQGERQRPNALRSLFFRTRINAATDRLLLHERSLTLPRSSLRLARRPRLARSTCSRGSRLRSS